MDQPTNFEQFVSFFNRAKKSVKNFIKSSFLSLLVIFIILLLLTQMDQAFTMMVDLIENSKSKFSLFLSFFFINALAIALSHYPIYTYYAANLNNSRNYTQWKRAYPFKFWPLKHLAVFIFTTVKDSQYTPDNWANYLRYLIGLLIHFVWIHFIISSFAPNLIFDGFPLGAVKIIVYLLLLLPFIFYIILKEKFTKYQSKEAKDGSAHSNELISQNGLKLNALHKRLGIYYFLVALISAILLIVTLFIANFSLGGFFIILLTSYALMFNYVFFRLLRTRLSRVQHTLTGSALLPVSIFIKGLLFLQKSENYIAFFTINFLAALTLIIYSTLASIFDWGLTNGIPLLLAFFYFYYFIIAALGKYFFVVGKMKLQRTRRFKIIFVTSCLVIALFAIGTFTGAETTTHELDLVDRAQLEIGESEFIQALEQKDANTLFFIASHGGGLKANVWTLNVVNKLQKETNGALLDRTIAFSGASGGSLGLALYTGLYRSDGRNTQKIQKKIDSLSHQNFTSIDLSLTFGLDTYRKLWPLNQKIGVRDRPYYKMRKYQNNIEDSSQQKLSPMAFRDFWSQTYRKTGYFPSLIMNTAGTKGNRGILWSVKQDDFQTIFPFSENLADLTNEYTLPFYQAVSTTNRFPVFSPAAKIPGYGHFIDAGAIDNSGLLGCLDVHNHLMRSSTVTKNRTIAYIEIINSKSLYINHLVEKFKSLHKIKHIDKNENETDNIVADIQTGLNLDKIPGYLSDYMSNWANASNNSPALDTIPSDFSKIEYFQLFMPQKVSVEDVKGFLGGSISDEAVEDKLTVFLGKENAQILALTDKEDKTFFEPWDFYEPTLSRHLSVSSIKYVHAILEHPMLQKQFEEIRTHTKNTSFLK